MEFEWDPRKAAHNRTKHGVSFPEAATAFADPHSVTFFDPDHSADEARFLLIGRSDQNRLVIVAHTDRGLQTRIISARLLKPHERRLYESPE